MRIHSLSYLTLSLVLPLSPYLFLYVIPPFLQAPTPPSVPLLTTLSSLPLSRSSSPSSASPYPPLSDYSSSFTPPPPPAWHILQPRQPPVWLQDYVTNCSLTVSAPTSQLSPVGSSTMLPPSHKASYTSPVGVCSLLDASPMIRLAFSLNGIKSWKRNFRPLKQTKHGTSELFLLVRLQLDVAGSLKPNLIPMALLAVTRLVLSFRDTIRLKGSITLTTSLLWLRSLLCTCFWLFLLPTLGHSSARH